MAVDTRNKRASAIGFLLAFRFIAPNPDASLATNADREQVLHAYADGRTAPPTPGAGADGFWIINTRRRRG